VINSQNLLAKPASLSSNAIIGDKLGPYEILEQVGKAGIGEGFRRWRARPFMNEIIWFDRPGGANPLAGANKWR
jgi:hypothetical protein